MKTILTKAIAGGAFLIVLGLASAPQAEETSARQAILVEVATGTVLLEKQADQPMPPASMSKLMTLYMVFERLKDGRLKMDDTFTVSRNAWKKGGAATGSSTMFLEPDSKVTVSDLIRGIIIQSGNDACIVVAEGLMGSEEAFAAAMTKRAKEIGLTQSHFANSTGWPHPDQWMSPRDLARLSNLLITEFPDLYPIFKETSFTHNNIKQDNRNPLLYSMEGADGLKTGHTNEAGYGLTASAVRDGRRLVLVVNGLESRKARAQETERLMQWGFREHGLYQLFTGGEDVGQAAVWLGQNPTVSIVVADALLLSMPKVSRNQMKAEVVYHGPLKAPIAEGETVGKLEVSAPGFETVSVPLVAAESVARLGLWGRLMAALEHLIFGSTG
ncbi:MAG: D-alanyl-D-alanine carboxypeptidase family protein [Magnetovibrionaceae bacterium]